MREHKQWHELTDEERAAPGAWHRFIQAEAEYGGGFVVELRPPSTVRVGEDRKVEQATELFVSFYALGHDWHGWFPDPELEFKSIEQASDTCLCVRVNGTWVLVGDEHDKLAQAHSQEVVDMANLLIQRVITMSRNSQN